MLWNIGLSRKSGKSFGYGMKRTLYASIARNLESNAGVKPSDIFIFMHENDYSDWSVGHGVFAMDLVQQVGSPK